MMHLEKYTESIAVAIRAFAPVTPGWAAAARLSVEDVRQEIALAALAGLDPDRAVPAALKIRKLGDFWCSEDAVCMAGEFDEDLHDAGSDDENDSANENHYVPPHVDGIEDLMQRHRIGRRAAQIRVKKQWDRRERYNGGDLFTGEN